MNELQKTQGLPSTGSLEAEIQTGPSPLPFIILACSLPKPLPG